MAIRGVIITDYIVLCVSVILSLFRPTALTLAASDFNRLAQLGSPVWYNTIDTRFRDALRSFLPPTR